MLSIFSMIFTFCKKETNESNNNTLVSSTGNVIFWSSSDIGKVKVSIDGRSAGEFTGHYQEDMPACGDSRCLTLTLNGGNHTYAAVSPYGTFTNSFTVVNGICNSVKIY